MFQGSQQSNHHFPPNIEPQLYSWIACAIGSLLVDDFNSNEQNSFGNWLILVGQFILTNAAQQQLINGRNRVHNTGEDWDKNHGHHEIDFLIESVQYLKQELENIKSKL